MPTARLPLSDFGLFHTPDLDEAREEVARIFCPHRLELVGDRLDAVQNAARLDDVSLSFLSYGGAVRITPGELETFYLVQIPLRGSAEIVSGRRSIVSTPTLASVLSPTEPIDMRWSANSPQLIVRFERAALERHLGSMVGRPIEEPVRFALGLDLGTAAAQSWLRLVMFLRDDFEHGELLRQPLAAHQFEQLLTTAFLLAQPSNYSSALQDEPTPASPRALRRAVEHVHAYLDRPLHVGDLAEAAGVSERALQLSFRRHLGMTPTEYVRDQRIEHAHADLVASDPAAGASVTDIALRWGFAHQGRFASAYRARYGVTPSQTLRR